MSFLKKPSTPRTLFLHVFLLPLAFLWLAPLWMMLVYSTLPDSEFYSPTTLLLPGSEFADNVRALLAVTPFTTALLNSLGIALISAIGSGILCCMAGYALAHFRFFGARTVIGVIVATLTVPYIVVTIPQFVMMSSVFQLSNHWAAVILPALCNSMGVFFMRQNFLLLPKELLDCARVEGVNEFAIFTRIAVPLVVPALTTVSIIAFLQTWNSYLWPMLMLSQPETWTAPVALGSLVGTLDRVLWGAIMAGTLLMTLPVILVFLFLQRHIVSGVIATADVK